MSICAKGADIRDQVANFSGPSKIRRAPGFLSVTAFRFSLSNQRVFDSMSNRWNKKRILQQLISIKYFIGLTTLHVKIALS
jgi:hypothetical protein